MALRLHKPTHDTEHGMQASVGGVGHETGDDGVVRALPGGEDVGVAGVEGEVGAAVLQGEAAAGGDDAGSEAAVVGVDEADGVALGVGDGEVDGVGGGEGRGGEGVAVLDDLGGLGGVEELGPLLEVGCGDELLGRDFDLVGVGDEPGGVGEGDAEGFQDGVKVGCGVVVICLEGGDHTLGFQLLDDTQCHEGYDTLAVGRVLPDLYAVGGGMLGGALGRELEGDGFDRLRAEVEVMLEIFELQMTA